MTSRKNKSKSTNKQNKGKAPVTTIHRSSRKTSRLIKEHGLLYEILGLKRPAGSDTEKAMIATYIDTLKPAPVVDTFGNRVIVIPKKDGSDSKTMFSCHTDTVHRTEGKQQIFYDTTNSEIFVDEECLGADDGTGIFIMISMIRHKIPGTYVFHRAEEIGCKGSKFIAANYAKWLELFERCIAFDRKGQKDVIIAQAPGIIASEKCGAALAEQLNKGTGFDYSTSKLGSITDSGQYYKQIPECINLAVGYERQHTSNEEQNLDFLKILIPKLIAIKWEELPVERKAGEAEPKYAPISSGYNPNPYSGWNGYSMGSNAVDLSFGNTALSNDDLTRAEMLALIRRRPFVALELLDLLNPQVADVWDAEYYSTVNAGRIN